MQTFFAFVTVKLIEYIFSAVKVRSNPCVDPLPSTNMSFPLLSISIEVLISAPKISTFWPNTPLVNEELDLLSKPIPYPEYLYLSMSTFLVKVTAPNKQFFIVGSLKLELDAPNS